jgi:hypothetical protein
MGGFIMASIISAGTSSGTALNMTADTSGQLQLATNSGVTAITINSNQTTTLNSASNPPLIIQNNGTEVMRSDTSGNFLVGCTGGPTGGTPGILIGSPANSGSLVGSNSTSSTFMFRFYNPNGYCGGISTSASATTYATSSDYRLKENIVPMTGALDKIAQLKPVTYTWKIDGTAGQGFIAHELQSVIPDCVIGEKDAVDKENNPIYQGVDTSFLVATLTAAIQELTERVKALESK